MAQPLPENVTPIAGKPTAAVVVVSPEIARRWLGHNTNNRRIRRGLVASYARDMANGNWLLDGAPIRFAADGTLLDGQHRLHAIIESGVALPLFVVRGLSREAQAVMDIGGKRSTADALRLRGTEGDVKDIAAVARGLLMFTTGTKPTHAEVLRFAEEHIEALDDAAKVGRHIGAQGLRGGSLYGTAFFILSRLDADAAAVFFTRLGSGENLGKGNPILTLRNKFLQGIPETARDVSSLRKNLAYIFLAWNAWREGRSLTVLRVKERFPHPK